MNAEQRFDALTDLIEQEVSKRYSKPAAYIAQDVCAVLGMGIREVNAVFSFLAGVPLLEYIRERKLMASYRLLITQDEQDINAALEVAGYDNQSSFTKSFRKRFGMTPGQAFKKRQANLYKNPLKWKQLSQDDAPELEVPAEVVPIEQARFGLEEQEFAKIILAAGLQELMNLNDAAANVAYRLANRKDIDMLAAFEFVLEIMQEEFPENAQSTLTEIQLEKTLKGKDTLIHLCARYGYSVHRAKQIMATMGYCGFNPAEVPDEVMDCFDPQFWTITEYMQLYRRYVDAGGCVPYSGFLDAVYDDNEFVEDAAIGKSLVDNVDEQMQLYGSLAEILERERDDMEAAEAMERWAMEETYGGEPDYYDYDPDMDNLAYEEIDNENEDDGMEWYEEEEPW